MEQISLGHPLISSREKKFMRLNEFWNIENEDKGTNIMWRGKDTLFQKHRGNQSRYFQMMETSWPTTNSTITYEYSSGDYIASLDIWKHENGTNVETRWLSEPSQMSLEILWMV